MTRVDGHKGRKNVHVCQLEGGGGQKRWILNFHKFFDEKPHDN